jgi:hypothetical protein
MRPELSNRKILETIRTAWAPDLRRVLKSRDASPADKQRIRDEFKRRHKNLEDGGVIPYWECVGGEPA